MWRVYSKSNFIYTRGITRWHAGALCGVERDEEDIPQSKIYESSATRLTLYRYHRPRTKMFYTEARTWYFIHDMGKNVKGGEMRKNNISILYFTQFSSFIGGLPSFFFSKMTQYNSTCIFDAKYNGLEKENAWVQQSILWDKCSPRGRMALWVAYLITPRRYWRAGAPETRTNARFSSARGVAAAAAAAREGRRELSLRAHANFTLTEIYPLYSDG